MLQTDLTGWMCFVKYLLLEYNLPRYNKSRYEEPASFKRWKKMQNERKEEGHIHMDPVEHFRRIN